MDTGTLDDIADVDAHSELDPPIWRHLRIPLGHSTLDLDGGPQRVHDARVQDQQSVASRSYDPATVFLDLRLNQLTMMSVQLSECAFVVSAYQAAVAGYIRYQNCHEPAFNLFSSHSSPSKEAKCLLRRSTCGDHNVPRSSAR
jgi:hypothetical protein